MLVSKLKSHAEVPRIEALTSNIDAARVRELPWNKRASSGRPSSILHQFDDIVKDVDIPNFLILHKMSLTFPEALLLLVAQAEREAVNKGRAPEEGCISWTSTGRALIIRDQVELINELLPIACSKTKFSSFVRKLYRWGFRQLSGQPLAAAIYKAGEKAYWHPLFQRDNKHLAINMRSVTADTRRLSECSQNMSQRKETKCSELLPRQDAPHDIQDQHGTTTDSTPIRPGVSPLLSHSSLELPIISSPAVLLTNRKREQLNSMFVQILNPPSLSISDQQLLSGLVGMPRFCEGYASSIGTAHMYSFTTAACILQPGIPQLRYDQLLQLAVAVMLPPSRPMFPTDMSGSLTEGERFLFQQHFGNI